MLFAIDIDQTIATGFDAPDFPACVQHYRDVGLAIPDTVTDYHSLFHLPHVMRLHSALPGSVDGVRRLSELGEVCYYTVRKHTDPVVEEEIRNITRQWLRDHHFPEPNNVVFCRSIMHKLIRLYELERDRNQLVLIDDRWEKVLEAFTQIAAGEYRHITDQLRNRLTIVAFGVSHCEINHELRVTPLPSWQYLDDVRILMEGVKCASNSSSARTEDSCGYSTVGTLGRNRSCSEEGVRHP